MSRLVFLIMMVALLSARAAAATKICSPDGRIVLSVAVSKGKVFYELARDGAAVMKPSALGFVLADGRLDSGFAVAGTDTASHDDTWRQVWGEDEYVRNHYNELTLHLVQKHGKRRRLDIVFRAFDDGIGFRYVIPAQPTVGRIAVKDEVTQFSLAHDAYAWSMPTNRTQYFEGIYTRQAAALLPVRVARAGVHTAVWRWHHEAFRPMAMAFLRSRFMSVSAREISFFSYFACLRCYDGVLFTFFIVRHPTIISILVAGNMFNIDMKNSIVLLLGVALSLGSCGTYTGQGAATGATFGSILGSAIGGITGGPRGSDIGTVVGMAGGAAVGAAVGASADKAKQDEYRRYMEYRDSRYGRSGDYGEGYGSGRSAYVPPQQGSDESGFDPTHSGDDRIVFDDGGAQVPPYGGGGDSRVGVAGRQVAPSVSVDELRSSMPGYKLAVNKDVEVRNITFVDASGDGALSRREDGKVSFEIMNCSGITLYDVNPTVVEVTGNKHVHVSPPLRVESIAPGRGVRYTATVYADSRVKDGEAVVRVAVVQGNKEITSQVREFRVPLRRR